jgi:hypothetical protein
LRSIRSCSRARRSSQRGIALVSAIVLAVLYFGLMELLLLDSARELAMSRRFRAKIVSMTLAENGAELAALQLASPNRTMNEVRAEDEVGVITGHLLKASSGQFEIEGTGTTKGVDVAVSKVRVFGRVINNHEVKIQYTMHE